MLYFKTIFSILLLTNTLFATPIISIIVSNNSNIDNITTSKIKNLFLSKTKDLPNGKKAIVLQPDDENINSIFYKLISGKSKKQLKKYWATMIFTGKGQPPKKIDDLNKLINYIKENPNAIAYVPKEKIKDIDVKVLLNLQ